MTNTESGGKRTPQSTQTPQTPRRRLLSSEIVPAWMWLDPAEIIDRLMWREFGRERRQPARKERDRYYTAARRVAIREAMRGKS